MGGNKKPPTVRRRGAAITVLPIRLVLGRPGGLLGELERFRRLGRFSPSVGATGALLWPGAQFLLG